MMNRFFTLLFAASCLTAVGQVTYPYNPDGNADGDIAVGDLQDFLVTYGNPFSPSEIMVGDSSLTYWVEQLSQTIQEQQEMIELLKGGDSRSLLYPDGLIGLESVSHDFASGPYTVPEGYNLYLHRTGGSPEDIIVGEEGVWNSIDGFHIATYVHNPSLHLPLGEGSVVDGPSGGMLIGFLAKRKVEVLTHSFYENQTLVVPDSKIFVASFLRPNNAAILVNGVPLIDPSALLIKPLVFSEGDTIAIAGTIDAQQFVLGYLVDEDYFETPLQDPSDEEPEEDSLGPCQGEFTVNYHGYDYELVEIGDQCWFAENLRTDKYLNGDEIPEVTGDEWEDLDEGAWRNWANDESYDAVYGKLYNGYAFNDSRFLCPTGFHSALHYDYLELGAFVGDASHMAYRLKTPSNYGTNDLGFSLKARGYLDDHGNFNWGPNHPSGQFYTSYWVNDPYSWYPLDSDANQRRMEISYNENANFTWGQWSMGGYVRCIKDAE